MESHLKTVRLIYIQFDIPKYYTSMSHLPLFFHRPAGVSIGMETLCAPTAAIESSMRSVNFRMDLVASGR